MKNDRRNFFKTVGVATATAVLAAPETVRVAAAVANDKFVPAFRQALSIDDLPAEEVLSLEGGGYRADVTNSTPVNMRVEKHISNIGYEDITVALGPSHSPQFYAWIQNMLNRTVPMRSGFIAAADAQGRTRSQLSFYNALITEVQFPELDSFSREPAEIVLDFAAEQYRQAPLPAPVKIGQKQKPWLSSNFRLFIDGLEESTARVTKVESFTVKQQLPPDQIGIFREPTRYAGPLEVSDLVFYCPEEFADPILAYAKYSLVDGHHLNADEKSGRLEFLAPDKKTVYFTLNFSNLGIFACSLEGRDKKASPSRRYKVEMYCEAVTLTVGPVSSP